MGSGIHEGLILPPDKSILHRLLIIGSLSTATIDIKLPSTELAEDISATIECLTDLGVLIERTPSGLRLQGVGMEGWNTPGDFLYCSNSGTTARLLMGALSGMHIGASISGDDSLSKRPMKRLANLLEQFGAHITLARNDGLPVSVHGTPLHAADIVTPVASAQIKSALLLAGLQAPGTSTITEPALSRNHTELMLQAFGADLQCHGTTTSIRGTTSLQIRDTVTYDVPCDMSAAYYLIAAAMLANVPVRLQNVLLNPTRTALLDVLQNVYKVVAISDQHEEWKESRGTIEVTGVAEHVPSLAILDDEVPSFIDEIPLLAVLGAFIDAETLVDGASELRYKESDRLELILTNLRNFGVQVDETGEGFSIIGNPTFIPKAAVIEHGGDHRIAMAFSLMGIRTNSPVTIHDPSVVNVSFPGYFTELEKLIGPGRLRFS